METEAPKSPSELQAEPRALLKPSPGAHPLMYVMKDPVASSTHSVARLTTQLPRTGSPE